MNVPWRWKPTAKQFLVVPLTIAVFQLSGCLDFSVDQAPTTNELIYDAHRRLEKQVDGVRRSRQLTGEREYSAPSTPIGAFITWKFKFENPEDVMKLTIFDSTGLEPGDEIQYKLSHVQHGVAVQRWLLQTVNPIGATKREHDFVFNFRLGTPGKNGMDFPFSPDLDVSGEYELTETTRAIEADIYFDVRRKMPVVQVGKLRD